MVCSIGRLYAKVNDYAQDNYYRKNQELANSQWYGKGSEILGLKGQVDPETYKNAYQGLDSQGNLLRQRQSGKKYNPGRDITLSAPKSVSLLGLVQEDQAVVEAHQQAVKATMNYIEQNCIYTRTGKGGTNLQQTDNAIFAVFQHDDNRNLEPQLHSHCVIFNLTQGLDGKWRTTDNRELYQQKMTIGMIYHHELGKRLRHLGYELNWNRDGTFEVRGYSQQQLKEFSTRRQEIEQAVGVRANAATKAQACTNTRRGKVYKAAEEREALKQTWLKQAQLLGISHPQPNYQHRQLTNLKEALRQSQGNYSLEDLQREINESKSLIKTKDGRLTTETAINREQKIINLARSGQDKYNSLANTEIAHQQAAVQAGSPFKLLQDQAQLPIVSINQNIRQQNFQLKEVVDLLSAGEIKQGYQKGSNAKKLVRLKSDAFG
jgi:conjugative relaxase-like TrwC/TraI family protein